MDTAPPRIRFLLQDTQPLESRAALGYCIANDIPYRRAADIPYRRAADIVMDDHLRDSLLDPGEPLLVPIGSVEFLRECMTLLGVQEPSIPSCFIPSFEPYLHRRVEKTTAGMLRLNRRHGVAHFVKPVKAKLFSGFLWSAATAAIAKDDYTAEQVAALHALPDATPLWIAEPVHFLREDRYYVLRGQVLGSARYDPDGPDSAAAPDPAIVDAIVSSYTGLPGAPCAFAADIGVLESGQTALVEINDAWALGLYGEMEDRDGYVRMIAARWAEITSRR